MVFSFSGFDGMNNANFYMFWRGLYASTAIEMKYLGMIWFDGIWFDRSNFYMFWRGLYASTAIEIAVEMNEDMAVLDDQGIWRRRTTQLNFDVL